MKLSEGACAIGRGLAVLGDAWSMLIMRDAALGLTRFDQFRSHLGIAPNILSARLRALTDAGVLEKRCYSERPPRDEYVMTQMGRDFVPILHAIGAWGRKYNGEGVMSQLVDVETGTPIDPVVIDRISGAAIGARPLRLVMPEE